MYQRVILIRSAPISHKGIQVGAVRVVITSTGTVHLAQTGYRKGLVLTLGL